ncbi:hypothetical protein CHCC5022_0001 [Bacillus paralicheniformis]|nr:hypothetical protein CHCC5022_0001 [Bacillus paralicheniformis]
MTSLSYNMTSAASISFLPFNVINPESPGPAPTKYTFPFPINCHPSICRFCERVFF